MVRTLYTTAAAGIRFLMAILVMPALGISIAAADVIYDSIPSPLPTNLPSEGYECCQLSEFGDEIQFAGTSRTLADATLTLSDWAEYSTYSSDSSYNSSGWSTPLTLTLYAVDDSGATPAVGSVIATDTITPTILWRPEPDGCDATGFTATDGSGDCVHGLAQNVTFDLSGVTVPDQIIFGLSFDTETYGADPIGVDGPYDSLNFALNDSASVGNEVDPGYLFLNTAGYDLDGGTVGVFSQNLFGPGYVPAIEFNAVPEPSTLALLLPAVLGLGLFGFRQRRANTA